MTNYEVLFILDPILEEEKKEAAVEIVKGIIETELVPWQGRCLGH
jgi:ribosomal protein S6